MPLTPTPLTPTCLCLVTRVTRDGGRQVLLGHKKTGLGRGKIVGLGGHVEPGESAVEAAAREVKEESGLHVQAGELTRAAHITFLFPARTEWDMTVTVFTAGGYCGEEAETDEIRPEWFSRAALPLDRMWDDARQWLPRVLDGERLRATFSYAADCQTVAASSIVPDSAISDSAISDSAISDSAISDSAISDSAISDSAISDSAISDSAISDSAIEGGVTPE